MSETLPLFPLGTVLYPGLLLPLHIFEERYRQLVRDLLDGPKPAQFGVIAIRKGRETDVDGVSALHEIGCTATLRQVTRHDDGRFELVTVGSQRFKLLELDDSKPYLCAEVEMLADEVGDEAAAALVAREVQRVFRVYLQVLSQRGAAEINAANLPDEPVLLSYLVAASMIIDLPDGQRLLAEPDALRLADRRGHLAGQGDRHAALAQVSARPRLALQPIQLELTTPISGVRMLTAQAAQFDHHRDRAGPDQTVADDLVGEHARLRIEAELGWHRLVLDQIGKLTADSEHRQVSGESPAGPELPGGSERQVDR